jgi:hypothetical protein
VRDRKNLLSHTHDFTTERPELWKLGIVRKNLMADLRHETLERIGVTQGDLNGMRAALVRLEEVYQDLADIGRAIEESDKVASAEGTLSVIDLELIRLERELESDVRQCMTDAAIALRK